MKNKTVYFWESVADYMDIDIGDGNPTTRIRKFLTLREFKEKIENGKNLVDLMSEGYSKHLLSFFGCFAQGKINLDVSDFRKDYDSGKSLQEIGEKYNVSKANMNFLRQIYQIKRLGTGYARRKRNDVKLTQRQREIIYGTLMGDGYRSDTRRNSALMIKHSEKQKEYVEWKYKELKSLVSINDIKYYGNFDKRYDKTYGSLYFYTRANSEILEINNQFYASGKREISKDILDNLTPLSIAVWFMDDGYSGKSKYEISNLIFCTDSFSKRSCNNIVKWFRDKWGIIAFLRERTLRNRTGYRVVIQSESAIKLIKMIEPYIIPSLKYKVINVNKKNRPKPKPALVKSNLQPDFDLPASERYKFLTKELLIEDYLKNGFSDRDLSFRYGLPKVVVWKKRQEFNIKREIGHKYKECINELV